MCSNTPTTASPRAPAASSAFPDGEDKPPRLQKEDDQAWTLAALANSYSFNGQPRQAVPLFEMQIAIREKQDDKKNLAIGLGNLANRHRDLGALRDAEANLRRRIALCREIGDEFREAIGQQNLGRCWPIAGHGKHRKRRWIPRSNCLRNKNICLPKE